jgi:hypothetical protein
MKTIASLIAVVAIIAIAAVAACSKDAEKGATKTQPPAGGTAAPVSPEPSEPAPAATAEALFAEYEAIRVQLANDTGEGVAARAAKTSSIAAELAGTADDAAKLHWTAAAEAATKLAAVDAGDLAALRLGFGELSRTLVELLESDAALAANYHMFECPMAEGYKRWIQPTAELENPYMGQKMLTCGAAVAVQPTP